jgi:hypothetical protein
MSKKPTITYPGVMVEEVRTSIKVIPGVDTSVGDGPRPSQLLKDGYEIVETSTEPGGVSMLLRKVATSSCSA